MEYISIFFVSFLLVFFSELGDKTQLLVLSFSGKNSAKSILLGVAIGTFFSHGLAIIFGTSLGNLENEAIQNTLKLLTYFTFLIFGICGFLSKKSSSDENDSSLLRKLNKFSLNCTLIVALSIFIGEIGDKTFLSSIGLGIEYPNFKISLILGSICVMFTSNSIAIFFGKLIGNKLPENVISTISNLIFIVFGIIGFVSYFV